MESKTPIFPMALPHHYSDYGFDPQIDSFQEVRRQGKKNVGPRSVDSLHFKLQKPISKDGWSKSKKRRQWWKRAFVRFWKSARGASTEMDVSPPMDVSASPSSWCGRSQAPSGQLYATETGSGASLPYRAGRPGSGPLRATEFRGTRMLPYISLWDFNSAEGHLLAGDAAPPSILRPIYLVT